jgi:hypothetical protein
MSSVLFVLLDYEIILSKENKTTAKLQYHFVAN